MGVKEVGLLGLVAAGLVLVAEPRAWADGLLLGDEPVAAGASFDDAIAAGDLAQARAGDFDITSVVLTNQNQTAEQSGNTIGGSAAAGAVHVAEGAMEGLHGMGQLVVNTGNQGVAQGAVTLNVILNPPPAAP